MGHVLAGHMNRRIYYTIYFEENNTGQSISIPVNVTYLVTLRHAERIFMEKRFKELKNKMIYQWCTIPSIST